MKHNEIEMLFLFPFLFVFLISTVVANPLSQDTGSLIINPITGNVVLNGSVHATTTTTTTIYEGTGGPGGPGGTGGLPGTTTTTLPPIVEAESVNSIPNGTSGNFTFQTLPITEVLVTVNDTVSNVQLSISETSTAPATVAIGAPGFTYAYLTITKTNITDKNISNVKIDFKIEKSWIVANGIDISTIALYRFVDGSWVALPTVKLSEDATYVYFEAESPGLSVFAITGQKVTTTTLVTTTTIPGGVTVPDFWSIVKIAAIFIIILALLFLLFKPRK